MRAICVESSANGCVRQSSTTKSLPMPCILVKCRLIAGRAVSVLGRRAVRCGLLRRLRGVRGLVLLLVPVLLLLLGRFVGQHQRALVATRGERRGNHGSEQEYT